MSLSLKRSRPRSRTAVIALVWALLTTPATTLPLLYWSESNPAIKRFAESLSTFSTAAFIGIILIGLPATAILAATVSLRRINSSWAPVGGSDLARYALGIAIFSTLAAALFFIIDLI